MSDVQFWRFVFSWHGAAVAALVLVVSRHPVGSAELTVNVLTGLGEFAATVLRLFGVELESRP